MKTVYSICLVVVLAFSTTILNAQVATSSLEINGLQRPSMYFEAEGNPSDIEDAIINYFKMKGFKKDKVKGGIIYFKNVHTNKVATTMDYYFKVSSKKKSKDAAIWLSTTTGGDAFTDSLGSENWKALNEFTAYLRSTVFPYYAFETKMNDKQKEIKNSKDDLSDLEKRKQKIEKEIEETKAKIEKQNAELADFGTKKDVLSKSL